MKLLYHTHERLLSIYYIQRSMSYPFDSLYEEPILISQL